MVGVKTTGVVRQLAESFGAVSSASEGVFLYYKFGRHEGIFSEKPYFLLSHCAHVLFTLWRFEEEEGKALFLAQPRPTAFLSGLDFGSLRYNDYKRRMLHADSFEDHWRNETQWFEFWIQILEHWDPSGVAVYQEFSRCILTCVTQGDILERKETHRNHSAFDRFMKTDAAGSVMLRTLSVLDEVMRGIVQCLAGLDPSTCICERIAILAALLNEMRRVVIYQTPARGPYTPLGATRWRAPSPLGRLFWGRTQGILTVVPKREGGDILCTYDPPSQPRNRRRSWTRAASSLTGTYEQELFATWPHETGACPDDPGHPSDVTARWTLQNEEAGRLETLARRIDTLLEGLACNPPCERLVAEVKNTSRKDNERWKAADLPWTYVRQLDELLGKLRFIYREASVPGGNIATEKTVAGIWPGPQTQTGETDSQGCEEQGDGVVRDRPASEELPSVVSTPQIPEPSECGIDMDEAQSAVAQALEELSALCLNTQTGPAVPGESGVQESHDESRSQTVAQTTQGGAQAEPLAPATPDSSPGPMPRQAEATCDTSASAWCAARLPTKRSPCRPSTPRQPRRTRIPASSRRNRAGSSSDRGAAPKTREAKSGPETSAVFAPMGLMGSPRPAGAAEALPQAASQNPTDIVQAGSEERGRMV